MSNPTRRAHTCAAHAEGELLQQQLCCLQGCGPKGRSSSQGRAPWKPAQIPSAPQCPGDTQGCIPKLCPEGAALGSHQPDPEPRAGVGDTCTTLPLPPMAQKQLIYNRATLQSPVILLFLGMEWGHFYPERFHPAPHFSFTVLGQKTIFSSSAQTQNFQFRLGLVSTAVIFKASKKDEEWPMVLLIWAILNWRGQTKVSLFIFKAPIQIASIQLQIISRSVTPTDKQYRKENS